ncbi:hypothetical protein TNCV_4208571 [Trichonephila clavipes]|nr:hypothetical protein TNCV_4208571 [Trichonephila clavipes]
MRIGVTEDMGGCGLNTLRVQIVQDDQSQNVRNPTIRLSAICMSPVELLYVPILLNETFTKSLWDTGAEKSFIQALEEKLNVLAEVSSGNPIENIVGENVECAVIRDLALSSREQRRDPELRHIPGVHN